MAGEAASAAPSTAAPAAAAHVAAENDEELFETYDEEGNRLGVERRSVCHADGILHRAVYCFVFNAAGAHPAAR